MRALESIAGERGEVHVAAKTEEWDDSAEMRFGAWDNKMVKDLEDDNMRTRRRGLEGGVT